MLEGPPSSTRAAAVDGSDRAPESSAAGEDRKHGLGGLLASRGTGDVSAGAVILRLGGMAVVLVVALLLPLIPGITYDLFLMATAFALAIWVIGLDVLVGYTGLVSFGHAAWLGIGGFACAYLMISKGWGFIPAMLAAMVIAGLIAIPFGYVATRVGGIAFAIVTLAEGVLAYTVIVQLPFLGAGNGLSGLPLPGIAGAELSGTNTSFYYFALAGLVVALVGAEIVVRSRRGRVWQAIRDDRDRTMAIGVRVRRRELGAFVVAAMIGAMGGAFYAVINGSVGISELQWEQSGVALIMLIVGGVGTLRGAIVGALVYVFASNYLSSVASYSWQLYLGGVFVFLVVVWPDGVLGALRPITRALLRPTAMIRDTRERQ